MTWAFKRQMIFGGIFLGIVIIFLLLIIVPRLNKTVETCFDNKQNQTEIGIDCGGPCEKLCPSQQNNVAVYWTRPFKISPNVYSAVAYMENPNVDAGIKNIYYKFTLRDANNIFITEKVGQTYIGPNQKTFIFESPISVGNVVPSRAIFEFVSAPVWSRTSSNIDLIKIFNKDNSLEETEEGKTRLTSTIINQSLYKVNNLEVAAILYDESNNAIAASRTLLDSLEANSEAQVFFTWPEALKDKVKRIEVIPKFNPFEVVF